MNNWLRDGPYTSRSHRERGASHRLFKPVIIYKLLRREAN